MSEATEGILLTISNILIVFYSLSLLLIFFYSLSQANMLWNYIKAQKKEDDAPQWDIENPNELPKVTVQLPVFNELYVMERLLEAASKLEYPRDKLQIQVLDDSTDESIELTRSIVEKLQAEGRILNKYVEKIESVLRRVLSKRG